MKRSSRTGAALVVTLSLLILLATCILAFMTIVRTDRQSAGLTSATTRAEALGRSMGNLVLSDLISEIRDGSTNIGGPDAVAYTPATNANMLPQRVLASSAMAAETNFANLYKQSVPGPFYSGAGYAFDGPGRSSGVGTWQPSRNGRVLSAERWNRPALLFGSGFTSTNELPRWVYITRHDTYEAARLNPTNWTAALANSSPTNADFVVGRVAYNIYEIGGCLDVNVAGGVAGATKQQLLASLSGAAVETVPGISTNSLPAWRNPVSGASLPAFLDHATNSGLKAGFLERPKGDRRFLGRQDLIAYAQDHSHASLPPGSLPYLSHFSRGLNRPSVQAESSTNLLAGYPARPAGANPAPLAVRHSTEVTLADGRKLPGGTPVAFRRFPLRRLSLLTEDARASASQTDPVYRYFGLSRASAGDPWIYNHGAADRILTLDEVRALQREPDFFEMLQAAIKSGSLGSSAGPYQTQYAADTESLDENIYRQILRIGACLIDQADEDDYPTVITFKDASGNPLPVAGVENLPYICAIGTLPYRPASLPRTRIRAYLQIEVWNPHQNAANADPGLKIRAAATKGRLGLLLTNFSGAGSATMQRFNVLYNSVIASSYGVSPSTTTSAGEKIPSPDAEQFFDDYPDLTFKRGSNVGPSGALDLATNPQYLEFNNSASFEEPLVLTSPDDPSLNVPAGHPSYVFAVSPAGSTSANSIVSETTPESLPLLDEPGLPSPGGRKLDSATFINFAGLLVSDFDSPDDRADGRPDQMSYGVPAPGCNNSCRLNAMSPESEHAATVELQVQTPNGWRTYQTIPNLRSLTTSNRIGYWENVGSVSSDKSSNISFIRPWLAARPQVYATPQINIYTGINMTWAIDPRSARYSYVLANSFGPYGGGKQTRKSAGYQIKGNGTDWMPATLSSGVGTFGSLPANIANNPTGQQYYRDPDGIVRRGDAEERPEVPTARQVLPMQAGYTDAAPFTRLGAPSDRPLILNRAFESVAEMGYAFRDTPWKSLDFWSKDSADGALLDYFAVEEQALDPNGRPLRAGVVNPNTAPVEVLDAIIRQSIQKELSTNAVSPQASRQIAESVRSALSHQPISSLADLPALADSPSFPSSDDAILRKTEKEVFARALAPVADVNVWNVLIDVIAQTGRFAPGSGELGDFIAQGEARYWIFAAIDRTTGQIIDLQSELVME